MADGGASATIAAAIIGASVTAAGTAASIATSSLASARGNLKGAVEVFNGTQYPLRPVRYIHRHGAFLGGIEGQFKEVPGFVDPRAVDTFVFEQNATTDNIGFVIFQCEIFDLLVGWHFYDQGKINRYMQASIFPKGFLQGSLPSKGESWGSDLTADHATGRANKMIWSGAGPFGNQQGRMADGIAPSSALKYAGQFRRGIIDRDRYGNVLLDEQGAPKITEVQMFGLGKEVNFSAVAYGGGEINKVYVSDTAALHNGSDTFVTAAQSDAFPAQSAELLKEMSRLPSEEQKNHPMAIGKDFELAPVTA